MDWIILIHLVQAKLPTIRVFLTIAAYYKWPVLQFDISNAFLHGHLKEEIYMSQPPGFPASTHPSHVCRLHKAIYGLKQAPREWFDTFTNQLAKIGFSFSKADSSLLIYHNNGIRVYLIVYVDDILLIGNDQLKISEITYHLEQEFNLRQLGPAAHFLGI